MKKLLLRISLIFITFTVGLALVRGFELLPWAFPDIFETPRIAKLKKANQGLKVLVLFNGFSTEKDRTVVNLEIVNISGGPVKYWSDEEKGDVFHLVKFNGEELSEFLCGTGLKEYQLSPNDSILIKQYAAYMFRNNFETPGVYQVSFSLGIGEEGYKKFWSPEFRIPGPIKDQIRKENDSAQKE
ncbi:MAG: hypothetical protein KDB79_01760 [Acidobacteria bacterium]|nr:hypothetical protein [Acidobacteriota bacterium]